MLLFLRFFSWGFFSTDGWGDLGIGVKWRDDQRVPQIMVFMMRARMGRSPSKLYSRNSVAEMDIFLVHSCFGSSFFLICDPDYKLPR